MRNFLLGTNKYDKGQKDNEVKGYNEKYERNVKITYLNPTQKKYLSSLLIAEEYSVVFCIPVSFRFTPEDVDLLEKYLHYRQREDHSRVTIAFTFSERLECTTDVYIDNLPEKLKHYLKTYGNNYIFINSSDNKNDKGAKRLIKPLPSKEFTRAFVNVLIVFIGFIFIF